MYMLIVYIISSKISSTYTQDLLQAGLHTMMNLHVYSCIYIVHIKIWVTGHVATTCGINGLMGANVKQLL